MVETAQEEEKEGDDGYLFSEPINIYTVLPGRRGEERRGEKNQGRTPMLDKYQHVM